MSKTDERHSTRVHLMMSASELRAIETLKSLKLPAAQPTRPHSFFLPIEGPKEPTNNDH